MSKDCISEYQTSRHTAGLTQEQAAELMHISVRTLAGYEKPGTIVPDSIVEKMVKHYNSPLLAWWHLRKNHILGKYIPDAIMPKTDGDMAFQLVIAYDELEEAVRAVKRILANGRVDDYENPDFIESIETIKRVNAKLFSVIIYAQGEHYD